MICNVCSLGANGIGDEGAEALAAALSVNRTLREIRYGFHHAAGICQGLTTLISFFSTRTNMQNLQTGQE